LLRWFTTTGLRLRTTFRTLLNCHHLAHLRLHAVGSGSTRCHRDNVPVTCWRMQRSAPVHWFSCLPLPPPAAAALVLAPRATPGMPQNAAFPHHHNLPQLPLVLPMLRAAARANCPAAPHPHYLWHLPPLLFTSATQHHYLPLLPLHPLHIQFTAAPPGLRIPAYHHAITGYGYAATFTTHYFTAPPHTRTLRLRLVPLPSSLPRLTPYRAAPRTVPHHARCYLRTHRTHLVTPAGCHIPFLTPPGSYGCAATAAQFWLRLPPHWTRIRFAASHTLHTFCSHPTVLRLHCTTVAARLTLPRCAPAAVMHTRVYWFAPPVHRFARTLRLPHVWIDYATSLLPTTTHSLVLYRSSTLRPGVGDYSYGPHHHTPHHALVRAPHTTRFAPGPPRTVYSYRAFPLAHTVIPRPRAARTFAPPLWTGR